MKTSVSKTILKSYDSVAAIVGTSLWAVLVAVLGVSLHCAAFGQTGSVTVSLSSVNANRGQTVTVPVTVSDLTGKGALSYDFTVNYDSSKLTPVGGGSCSSTPSCFDSANTISSAMTIVANSSTSGKVIASAFGTSSLSGSGTLINLKFTVNSQASGTAALTWQSFAFNEGTPSSSTSNGTVTISSGRKPIADFDGDGKTDVGIWRQSGASGGAEYWYLKSGGTVGAYGAFGFGQSTDIATPADFTGDGKTDLAFFRPSNGYWYILRSEDSTYYAFPFGANGDTPAPADYDGDGKADPTVFRSSGGVWYVLRSGDGGVSSIPFGVSTDKPIPGDYDGDGKADVAVFRSGGANGAEWWYFGSTAGGKGFGFGESADKAVPADYTGDGKIDLAFFRPGNGSWYILRSEDFSFYAFPFGANGDVPSPGDYDGDGKLDAAVFRAGQWYIYRSSNGGVDSVPFGSATDKPLTAIRLP